METKIYTFILYLLLASALLLACNMFKENELEYKEQIGDTTFDSDIDDKGFKFCDSLKVLHSRSRITYDGGFRNFEEGLIKKFNSKNIYKSFSGYFIIRFAVNCKNETGRFRWEVVNENFDETKSSPDLEREIVRLVKSLDSSWNSVLIDGKKHDGYTFISIKIENGKIVKS